MERGDRKRTGRKLQGGTWKSQSLPSFKHQPPSWKREDGEDSGGDGGEGNGL